MKNNKGFTLIELAMVVVIIALLIAGVLAGKDLIGAGEVTSIVSEFQKYKKAYYSFEAAYGQYPGDFADAIAQLGAGNNGNGDGQIAAGGGGEEYYAWNHLGRANIIDGNYTGTVGFGFINIGSNIPAAKFNKKAGYRMSWSSYYKNVLALVSSPIDGPSLTARNAWTVDTKLDDGIPSSGDVRGVKGSGATGNCCSVGAASPCNTTASTYNLQDSTTDCYLQIILP